MVISSWILIVLFGVQFTASEMLRGLMISDLTAAIMLAVASAVGSVVLTHIFVVGLARLANGWPTSDTTSSQQRGDAWAAAKMWGPIGLFTLGMVFGYKTSLDPSMTMINLGLFVLICTVGVQSGMEVRNLPLGRGFFTRRSLVLFTGLPVTVIGGTLLFSASVAAFLPFTWRECMLSAAPMGWQTLGGPMVLELHSVRLGNLAFLVNMFRDIVSLLLIPIVCSGKFKILGLAPGGVSTMDILLPIITASAGKAYLIYAMWVGACCSFWAPILIWLISEVLP